MPNTGIITNGNVSEVSGVLYNKTDITTPLFNAFGTKSTNHVEFTTNSDYDLGEASQPAISETASLTAPDPSYVTRDQHTNVTQIFQRTIYASYAKLSNMGTLTGINISNQTSNIDDELTFQTLKAIQKTRRDIEYTIINGTYNKATSDGTINKTRGLLEAISTSVVNAGGQELNPFLLGNLIQTLYNANAPTDNLLFVCSPITARQITKNFAKMDGFNLPSTRTVGGMAIKEVMTDFGTIGIMIHKMIPNGTALLLNMSVINNVNQPTPGKGNFFVEELARTGAGIKKQLFGQWGLDYGAEWLHAKLTNLSTVITDDDGHSF